QTGKVIAHIGMNPWRWSVTFIEMIYALRINGTSFAYPAMSLRHCTRQAKSAPEEADFPSPTSPVAGQLSLAA
ncbi:hypothetical protein ABTA63_19545, partial [Acinetobacter baumannii]